MSAVQQAAANTVLRIANLFEQNCALKWGLPKVGGPDRIDVESPPPAKVEPPVVNITNQIPAAMAATESPSPGATAAEAVKGSLLRRAAPWLIAAATGGAGGIGLPLLWEAVAGDKTPPAVVAEPVKDGSLLQYLEDGGYHRPEGAWPTK